MLMGKNFHSLLFNKLGTHPINYIPKFFGWEKYQIAIIWQRHTIK